MPSLLGPMLRFTYVAGEGLPINQQVFRVKVTIFLRSGVPFTKFNDLEEGAYHLSSRHSLSDLSPFILRREMVKIMEELNRRCVSL